MPERRTFARDFKALYGEAWPQAGGRTIQVEVEVHHRPTWERPAPPVLRMSPLLQVIGTLGLAVTAMWLALIAAFAVGAFSLLMWSMFG
jgi:hypothetical protein